MNALDATSTPATPPAPATELEFTDPPDRRRLGRCAAVFLVLVAYLAAVRLGLEVIDVRFPHPSQKDSLSWLTIAIVAAAGLAGVWLAGRTGFPAMLDRHVSHRRRFAVPAVAGVVLGLAGIAIDATMGLSQHIAQRLQIESVHLDFPASLFIYPAGAIIVSVFYYLLPVPLIVWIVSNLVLRGRGREAVFWIAALVAAMLEPVSQAALFAPRNDLTLVAGSYIFLAGVTQLYAFRRAGFLAALTVRLAQYAVWHVIWPLVS